MALVKFGLGIAELRGAVGGSVYSRARGGATVRNKTNPVNPNTIYQDAARERFSNETVAFNTLTPVQLQSWATLAQTTLFQNVFGESYAPSAKQLFMTINMNRAIIEMARLLLAPANSNTPLPPQPTNPLIEILTTATADVSNTLLTYALAGGSVQTGVKWALYSTPPINTSIENAGRYYRFIGYYTPGITVNFFADYQGRFGAVAAIGENIQSKLVSISTTNGMRSDSVDTNAPITI